MLAIFLQIGSQHPGRIQRAERVGPAHVVRPG
jgi:hypothetical protein